MSQRSVETTIRPAEIKDLAELTRLGVGIQKLHHEGRPDIFREPDEAALQAFFEARIADGSHLLVAATVNGIAGYLLAELIASRDNPFKRASSVFYIQHIAVQPAYQSVGVGRRLMRSASDLAGELGAAAMRLDSWHFNVNAHDFFKSQGFAPVNYVFERRLG